MPVPDSTPAEQLGVPQDRLLGKLQDVALVPSHRAPQVPPAPVQAVREPTGAPMALAHVPSDPGTLHAWHWFVHAELQQ